MNTFYITTTLPYVNADPHIGFAMEIVRADIIARYKKIAGFDVFFNTGTDEHGIKVYQKAKEEGKDTQAYVDEYAERYENLKDLLGLSSDIHFIRTTDGYHKKAAQEFWKICKEKGYIYKKKYKGLYCIPDELFLTGEDLRNRKCPNHPDQKPIEIEEENYFFKFSEFQKPLLKFYEKNPRFVIPNFRFNEIKKFIEMGLEDFSISRLKEKMPWGVPVPDDPLHVMYVWFDALVNYISTLGWPDDEKQFDKFWKNGMTVQYAGKDNLRQQSAMWQAMLMAVGLPNTKQIVINGFIISGKQKMSKSIGNVISPYDIVEEYGTDALRYYIAREFHPFEDSDFTMEKFKDAYNANLANGLGNLVSRIMKMAVLYSVEFELPKERDLPKEYKEHFDNFELNKAADFVWKKIGELDLFIQKSEPFKKIKTDENQAKSDVGKLVVGLWDISILLEPFLPDTAKKIQELIKDKKTPDKPLFTRKD